MLQGRSFGLVEKERERERGVLTKVNGRVRRREIGRGEASQIFIDHVFESGRVSFVVGSGRLGGVERIVTADVVVAKRSSNRGRRRRLPHRQVSGIVHLIVHAGIASRRRIVREKIVR